MKRELRKTRAVVDIVQCAGRPGWFHVLQNDVALVPYTEFESIESAKQYLLKFGWITEEKP